MTSVYNDYPCQRNKPSLIIRRCEERREDRGEGDESTDSRLECSQGPRAPRTKKNRTFVYPNPLCRALHSENNPKTNVMRINKTRTQGTNGKTRLPSDLKSIRKPAFRGTALANSRLSKMCGRGNISSIHMSQDDRVGLPCPMSN